MRFEKGLTIVIPTYNRRDRLIKQLESLFSQREKLSEVRIIIADNNSNYCVSDELKDSIPIHDYLKLEFITRPYNMGMGFGLTLPISYCKTRWLWILSDDDEVVGDINELKKDIDLYSDFSMLKYNNVSGLKQEEEELYGIYDFLNYYERPNHNGGDLLFLSNSIFNVEKLYIYNKYAFIWAGTLFGHLIPILYGLCDNRKEIKCKMRDYNLVKYLRPETPVDLNKLLSYYMSFSILDDMTFPGEEYDKYLHRRICRIIQKGGGLFSVALTILNTRNRREARNEFYRIYYASFDYGLKNHIVRFFFDFSLLLRFNFLHLINKMLKFRK